MTLGNSKPGVYSRQGLWSLFLMCAFPLHFWTLMLAFRDLSWLIDRSDLWDAVSNAAYGMIFALAESVMLFAIAVLLGFLVAPPWDPRRRVAVLSVLVLIAALWAIAGQLAFLSGFALPAAAARFLAQQAHPVRVMYAGVLALVLPSVLLPAYFVLKSERTAGFVWELIDRLATLAVFYLFFDSVGLVIVILRNV